VSHRSQPHGEPTVPRRLLRQRQGLCPSNWPRSTSPQPLVGRQPGHRCPSSTSRPPGPMTSPPPSDRPSHERHRPPDDPPYRRTATLLNDVNPRVTSTVWSTSARSTSSA
jgi:hypothetical protein